MTLSYNLNNNNSLSHLSKSILKTLAYYDIFSYPLTDEEIFRCTNTNGHSKENVFDELNYLASNKIINFKDGFYFINHDHQIIEKRIDGNKRAENKMKTARKFSKFISYFPYVRGIALSGSISKGYMDSKADIDYFIITEPNRLWIARIFLVFFKKIFLFNSYKLFCINYFVSTVNLEIEEKNIYTAIELATLIPTYGAEIYSNIQKANGWIKNFIPNYPEYDTTTIPATKRKITQIIIESLLNNKLGDYLDNKVMKLFIRYDEKRYGKLDEEIFKLAFKTRRNVSKHHPNFFQKRVLDTLKEKLEQLELKHNIALSEVE